MRRLLVLLLSLLATIAVASAVPVVAQAAPTSPPIAGLDQRDAPGGEDEPPPPTTRGRFVERFDSLVERVSARLERSGVRRAADRFTTSAERVRERLCERPRVRC